MVRAFFYTVLIALSFTSCKSLQYFTQDMHDAHNWTENDLRQIQFYLSEDVVLHRSKQNDDVKIEDGEVVVDNEKRVDEVVVKKGTPGVLVKMPKDDLFYVAFDVEDSKFLVFGPNVRVGNRYVIQAKEWKNNRGKVSYGNATYYLSAANAKASIMIDVEKLGDVDKSRTKAKGRKL